MKQITLLLGVALIVASCSKTTTPITPTVSQTTNTVNLSDNYFDWKNCSGSGRVYLSSLTDAFGNSNALCSPALGMPDTSIRIIYSNATFGERLFFTVNSIAIGTETLTPLANKTGGVLTLPVKYVCKIETGQTYATYFGQYSNNGADIPGNIITITQTGKVGELIQGTFKLKLLSGGTYNAFPDTAYVSGHFSVKRTI